MAANPSIADRIAGAEVVSIEPPRPLRRQAKPPAPFPLDALGPILQGAAAGTHVAIQAPIEVCAQSALANAALAVQGHVNVMLPTGQSKPTVLFLMSVAETGSRKSAADHELNWAVLKHERNLEAGATDGRALHKNDLDAWNVSRAQLKQQHKDGPRDTISAALAEIGPEPKPPLDATMISPEPTIEGIQKYLAIGQPSMGVFSDEGGMFVGGVGMSRDNALKTAAGYSKFWDGSSVRRLRAGDGNLTLHGRRVSMHLMLQPGAASEWLANGVLRDQGLFSRMLIAAPASMAGQRFNRAAPEEARDAIRRFHARILTILETPWRTVEGKPEELDPRDITFSAEAEEMWWDYRDAVEREVGPGGKWAPVAGLANKIYEQAARLATIIAMVDDLHLAELSASDLARGIELANWYLGEALRLTEVGNFSVEIQTAEMLLTWLHSVWPTLSKDGGDVISTPDVYQVGPNSIREKAIAAQAIAVLVDHGWLIKIDGGASVNGVNRREAYRVRRA